MFRKLLLFVLLFGFFGSPSFAQDWRVDPPHSGWRLRSTAWGRVEQGGAVKNITPENDRSTSQPIVANQDDFFSSVGKWSINHQRVVHWGGAIAFAKSVSTVNWDYWTPGTSKAAPSISAEYELESKVSAPVANPPICATSEEYSQASANRNLSKYNPTAGVTYTCMGSVTLTADYESKVPGRVVPFPLLNGHLYARFGQSSIDAKWDSSYENPDETYGAWVVTERMLNQANGQVQETVGIVHGPHFNETWTLYAQTVGNQPFTIGAYAGKNEITSPLNVPESQQDPRKKTYMHSIACSQGTTGTDSTRDETWKGSVKVTPVGSVYWGQ